MYGLKDRGAPPNPLPTGTEPQGSSMAAFCAYVNKGKWNGANGKTAGTAGHQGSVQGKPSQSNPLHPNGTSSTPSRKKER
jgi:hypothetical protein